MEGEKRGFDVLLHLTKLHVPLFYSGSRSHTFNWVKYGIMQVRSELLDVLKTNITSDMK